MLGAYENCGIVEVTYVSSPYYMNSDLYICLASNSAFLLEGLTVLKNRGYDSAGIATLSPKNALVRLCDF